METLLEYSPTIAEASIEVPDYSHNRFMAIDENKTSIRPIVDRNLLDINVYKTSKPINHKFWVIGNNTDFRSALSKNDLADTNNIVGIGCFVHEIGSNKYFTFNLNDVIFYGPAIFPNGGTYISLYNWKVIHQGIVPNKDYNILKSYLSDISNVKYWDFEKHS
jgi:hypothetical protein